MAELVKEFDVIHRTRNALNPSRKPNEAKYRGIANRENTWERMVNSTDFAASDGCWEWTKGLNDGGYGVFATHDYGNVMAHRLALHVAGRPVPADMTVDHLCRNRKCVNPSHLEIVTEVENLLRGNGYYAVNARKTHCPQGHEYSAENTYLGKPRTKTGGPVRQCKACSRQRYQASRQKVA